MKGVRRGGNQFGMWENQDENSAESLVGASPTVRHHLKNTEYPLTCTH